MKAVDIINFVPSMAAICFACLVYVIRKRLLEKIGNRQFFSPFVDAQYLCVLVGAVFGSVSTHWFHGPANFTTLAVLFFAGWIGFTVGCGLDIRVLRRSGFHSLLPGFVQTLIALVLVPSFMYGFSGVAGGNSSVVNPVSVLCITAICVAGSSSLIQFHGSSRIKISDRLGFPCVSGFFAISLIAFAGTILPSPRVKIPAFVFWDSQSLVIEGIEEMLLGMLLGSLVGFFCDLLSRESQNTTVLLFTYFTFVLLGVGLAQLFGLQPLWMGAFSGLWLINSTLRRLDILNAVAQSRKLVNIVLPLSVGCLLGKNLSTVGLDWQSFSLGVVLMTLVRPTVKVFSAFVVKRSYTIRDLGSLSWIRGLAEFEHVSLMAALVLFYALGERVGAGMLTGTISGNFFLSVFFPRTVTTEDKVPLRERPAVQMRTEGLTGGTDVTGDLPEP